MNHLWLVHHRQIGCGKKRCIFSLDTVDGNMCAWRCLIIYMQGDIKRGTEFVTKVTLNLARELRKLK